MREDLVFHLVKKRTWQNLKKEGRYHPESLESDGFIHCSSGKNIEAVANRKFKGERRLLLIVINASLVEPELKYEEDEESGTAHPHIYGPLNLDAVIDKIELHPEKDGRFSISFSEQ